MSDSPEAIRANIDRTREELGRDVDALADKVTPSKIAQRQTDKVKGAFSSVRERIMGAADDVGSGIHGAGSSIHDAGSSVVSGASEAGRKVSAKAEGNPLAVGLIAFGVGLVAAALIPASEREKRVAENVKEQAQPLMEEAQHAAQEVGQHLKEPAQEAVAAVKESATDAASTVKEEATGSAQTVADRAREARENVGGNS
jgi:gas vesicle protein